MGEVVDLVVGELVEHRLERVQPVLAYGLDLTVARVGEDQDRRAAVAGIGLASDVAEVDEVGDVPADGGGVGEDLLSQLTRTQGRDREPEHTLIRRGLDDPFRGLELGDGEPFLDPPVPREHRDEFVDMRETRH